MKLKAEANEVEFLEYCNKLQNEIKRHKGTDYQLRVEQEYLVGKFAIFQTLETKDELKKHLTLVGFEIFVSILGGRLIVIGDEVLVFHDDEVWNFDIEQLLNKKQLKKKRNCYTILR